MYFSALLPVITPARTDCRSGGGADGHGKSTEHIPDNDLSPREADFLLKYYSKFAIMLLKKRNTMYEIEFYEDKNGKSETADYIKELNNKAATSKE